MSLHRFSLHLVVLLDQERERSHPLLVHGLLGGHQVQGLGACLVDDAERGVDHLGLDPDTVEKGLRGMPRADLFHIGQRNYVCVGFFF